MFNKSELPNRTLEFVVVPDTHYMLPQDDVEFESRRRQTERATHALVRINDLDPDFVVHLGDIVQSSLEEPTSTPQYTLQSIN